MVNIKVENILTNVIVTDKNSIKVNINKDNINKINDIREELSKIFKCKKLILHIDGIKEVPKEYFKYSKYISEVILSNVEIIGDYAFEGCTNLRRIIMIDDSVKTIGNHAFTDCHKLEEVNLSNNITSIGNHAFYFTNIKRIILPNSLEYIGDYAFAITSLSTIVIPEKIKYIPAGTFYMSSIRRINIPENIEEIREYAFAHCNNLKSIILNNNLKRIHKCAFIDCFKLQSIKIPKTTIIDDYAFLYDRINIFEELKKKIRKYINTNK